PSPGKRSPGGAHGAVTGVVGRWRGWLRKVSCVLGGAGIRLRCATLQTTPMSQTASRTLGFCASLARARMRARHEEKRGGTVFQKGSRCAQLAIHFIARCAPCTCEDVLESNLFLTLPGQLRPI